ncbi:uncharacterized protein TrAtP1_007725 [Trichoderma atroviride]|uniref:uncharacterized protein n=1 Tax=Hypocrea atroviridis TaxID=63577 RepID=UPI0033211CAB|nr:hypothetical protein TrAtP1_007725 [Trichoderma atroviride]
MRHTIRDQTLSGATPGTKSGQFLARSHREYEWIRYWVAYYAMNRRKSVATSDANDNT